MATLGSLTGIITVENFDLLRDHLSQEMDRQFLLGGTWFGPPAPAPAVTVTVGMSRWTVGVDWASEESSPRERPAAQTPEPSARRAICLTGVPKC